MAVRGPGRARHQGGRRGPVLPCRDAVAGGPHGRSRHACNEARLVPRAVGAAHAHHRRARREVAAMNAARQDVRRPGRRSPRIPDPARRGRRW